MSLMQDILFDEINGMGVITLNRPQALNALNMDMVRALTPKLKAWAVNPDIHAVLIEGAGDKAFCSGGDVKTVALEGIAERNGDAATGTLRKDFFREEYTLNHLIYTFPKPYISLINGIVMGGGKGLSAHGSHRVVSEKVMFAMPETNIGFFPDVGGGYFLPRCPGQTGLYLALTSKRIGAADTLYVGFATHYVASVRFAELRESLTHITWNPAVSAHHQVSDLIQNFTCPVAGNAELALFRDRIDACFAHETIEEIVDTLKKDTSAWGEETLNAVLGMSPTSLKLTLRQIRRGASMGFADVMKMEYRLSQYCMAGNDFYEGIRAVLIDKDKKPRWNPSMLADVRDSDIDRAFLPLTTGELIL